MILTEKEKGFIRQRFSDELSKNVFNGILEKKVSDVLDASTFKKLDSEKEMPIEQIYMARMAAAFFIRELVYDLLRISNSEGEEAIT